VRGDYFINIGGIVDHHSFHNICIYLGKETDKKVYASIQPILTLK